MTIDLYGGQHSSRSARAVQAFEQVVFNIAAHKPNAPEALASTLAADEGFVAAHAIKGFAGVLLGRAEPLGRARTALAQAELHLGLRGGTGSERVLVQSLRLALEGEWRAAADGLDGWLEHHPQDFLAFKLAHGLRFMTGDGRAMLASTQKILPHWRAQTAGYGYLLGCHAFALEEAGHYIEAERFGRAAVELEPNDSWGLHAVSHVFEMNGRVKEGVRWLEQCQPVWSQCNNFAFHMAWHLALFHVELGEHTRALQIYDRDVRAMITDDFRDIANAVSLLWRMRQEKVEVGTRWDELREIAQRRLNDRSYVFASLHHLLTLVAVGDFTHAEALCGELAGLAQSTGDQARVARDVGLELAQQILVLAQGQQTRVDLGSLALRLPQIGGSNAQRDVFVRALTLLAAERGRSETVSALFTVRRRLKRDDHFTLIALEQLSALRPTSGPHKHVA